MNKKGFTIIELLAVILVVSLLLIIGVPTILKFMKQGTKSYYTSLENEVKVAGVDYVETYRSLLPQNIGHVRVIELEELVNNKYIDPVKDEKGNNCTGQVTIKKTKTDSYEYYSCLKCGEYYQSKEENCGFSEYDNQYADSGDYRIEVEKDVYIVNQTEKFTSPLAKVYYKDEQEPIKTDLKGNPDVVDTNKVGDKEVVYYYHGAKKTITVRVVDNVNPSKTQIVLKYKDKNGKSYRGEWYSGNIYVAYKATDYTKTGIKGSGIDHYEVSSDGVNFVKLESEDQAKYKKLSATEQSLILEGNYIRYVRAVDKNGNIGPVNSYRVKIDKTKPTCSLVVTSGTKYGDWYNTNVAIGFQATNGTVSNIASKNINYPSITSPVKAKLITGTVKDEAGNSNTCTITVNMDNKKPANPVIKASDNIASNKWHKGNFTLTYSGASNISGNLYYYRVNAANGVTNGRANGTQAASTNITTETTSTTYYALVCSVAGLCSGNSSYIIKLDKTNPTISAKSSPISLGNGDYNFTDNVNTTCGISGCTTTCNPAKSKKTGTYNVTCTITSNSGLSKSITFAAKHQYQVSGQNITDEGWCGKHECDCHHESWGCGDIVTGINCSCPGGGDNSSCGGSCWHYTGWSDTCSGERCHSTCANSCTIYTCPDEAVHADGSKTSLSDSWCYYR